MGYMESLEMAGAKVLSFKEFGSYQGTWLAIVEFNGEKGIVEGSYGSCSGCDAFEAEFGCYDSPVFQDGVYYKTGRTWDEEDECSQEVYNSELKIHQKKISDFGMGYLRDLYTVDHYKNKLEKISKKDESDWFDEEEKEYSKWVIHEFYQ